MGEDDGHMDADLDHGLEDMDAIPAGMGALGNGHRVAVGEV